VSNIQKELSKSSIMAGVKKLRPEIGGADANFSITGSLMSMR
jgi:hypothetical protein